MTGVARAVIGQGRAAHIALVALALGLTALLIGLPLVVIFVQAFSKGVAGYLEALNNPDMRHAVYLTLVVAVLSVPVNIVFGIAAAWAIARFRFPGRRLLVVLIELPLSVSPVVAGVCYLLLYGSQGLFGPFLEAQGIQLMFALPGIVMVTIFVTCPYVAREVLPLMEEQGKDEEETAVTLGARGWQILWRVTLPNIRWALLYGAILCTARAIGEFGAVSVVSGNVRGVTNTLPLQVELLYHSYNVVGAFTAATLLTLIALVALGAKAIVERMGVAATAGRRRGR